MKTFTLKFILDSVQDRKFLALRKMRIIAIFKPVYLTVKFFFGYHADFLQKRGSVLVKLIYKPVNGAPDFLVGSVIKHFVKLFYHAFPAVVHAITSYF